MSDYGVPRPTEDRVRSFVDNHTKPTVEDRSNGKAVMMSGWFDDTHGIFWKYDRDGMRLMVREDGEDYTVDDWRER